MLLFLSGSGIMADLVEVLEQRAIDLTARLDASIARLNALLDPSNDDVSVDDDDEEIVTYDYVTACPPTPEAKGMNFNIEEDDETIIDEYDIDYYSDEFADFHINWYPDPLLEL